MTVIIILILLLFAAAVALCLFLHHQNNLSIRAHLMREAVRNRDFTFRLPVKGLFYGERALQEALNDLGQDINRLVARNEVESWQKLTRVLTHEIMNVTTPIQSISQAYLESPRVQGTPLEKGICAINEAMGNLITFVGNYRKLTQLQNPVISSLRLRAFVDAVGALHPDASWKTSIPANLTVQTDEALLRQVFVNIIKNAMEAGARTVECVWDDAMLHVSNDGNPIPAEVRKDIFVPFYTTKSAGTGIGLALSRQIMTMLGGSLMLADKARRGYHTTFVLEFGQESLKG